MVFTFRVSNMEYNQVWSATTIYVCNSYISSLIIVTEAGWNKHCITPSGYISTNIQVPSNSVITLIVTSRIINIEDNQVWSAITIYIPNSNPSSLILISKPTGYRL